MLESAQIKLKEAVRKTIAALTAVMLALVLLTALLITGFYLLIRAAIMALTPVVGDASAMALVGAGCVLLLVIFFWQMTRSRSAPKRSGKSSAGTSPLDELREVIRENPLESALTAFAVGVAQQSDPRLRSLLMQGGMELMKRAEAADGASSQGDGSGAAPPPTGAATETASGPGD